MIKNISYILLSLICTNLVFAQKDTTSTIDKSIKKDVFIHPADGYTAYTLPKGQWIYTQPIDLKPGVIQIGLNDKNTIILPANHWAEKTVSIGYRRSFSNQHSRRLPAIALEMHYQYLTTPVNQIDFNHNIEVWRLGHNFNLRANFSWHFEKDFYIHFSSGATYTELFNVNIPDSSYLNDITTGNSLTPDILLNIEWRPKNRYALFLQVSYGSTFFYAENTARKKQILAGTRLAPFYKSKKSFLSHFRIELAYLNAVFDKNDYFYNTVSGNLYWNFRIKK